MRTRLNHDCGRSPASSLHLRRSFAGRRRGTLAWLVGLALVGGCTPSPGPGDDALAVEVGGGAQQIAGEGDAITLAATASGGAAPYLFRWSQESGVDALAEDASLTEATLTTQALVEQGEYAFRIVVTDAEGTREEEWVLIRVGPPGACDSDFCVAIDGPESVDFGDEADFSAFVSTFDDAVITWSVFSGSATLSSATGESTSFEADALDRIVIQAQAVATSGQVATDTHSIEVVPALTVEGLHLSQTDRPVNIPVSAEPQDAGVAFEWSVESGDAEISGETTEEVTVTPRQPGTITLRVSATAAVEGSSEPVTGSRTVSVVAVTDLAPQVVIATDLGDITLELDAEKAPLTTANFLRYVDEGFYDGVTLHRYSCELDFQTLECREPFVIQGGGYEITESGLTLKDPTHDAVQGEQDNGLSNTVNTLSMALAANDPDSATTQFFFNLNPDNTRLDGDFTAFGKVVAGADVLDAIMAMETREDPITGGRPELLVEPVVMTSVRRAEGS
ncbi:MAG: peptidylprolyl isomerase [Phycisphaerales bacterium]|nr:peptidylprolyl isomerase [Phycisphaerales bacterium]